MATVEKSKKFFEELAQLASDVVAVVQDGKIDYKDIPQILDAMKELGKLSSSDIAAIKAELSELTENEREELKLAIAESFDIENDNLELLIEKLIGSLIDFADSVAIIVERAIALKDYLVKK